jgi:hypothetical protein
MEMTAMFVSTDRELTAEEQDLINEGRQIARAVEAYTDKLRKHSFHTNLHPSLRGMMAKADARWVEHGAIQLQSGFMALARAIVKPTNF